MRAIITVIGKDRVGIISAVSNILSECNVNILDISQTIMQDMFTMMMLVDVSDSNKEFASVSKLLDDAGKDMGLSIRMQHEDIFNSMHRI